MSASKSDIASRVAEELGISKSEAGRVVGAVFYKVGAALAAGEDVRVSNFGTFVVKRRPARVGRHPVTGEPIDVPASKKVSFKIAADLKRGL